MFNLFIIILYLLLFFDDSLIILLLNFFKDLLNNVFDVWVVKVNFDLRVLICFVKFEYLLEIRLIVFFLFKE